MATKLYANNVPIDIMFTSWSKSNIVANEPANKPLKIVESNGVFNLELI